MENTQRYFSKRRPRDGMYGSKEDLLEQLKEAGIDPATGKFYTSEDSYSYTWSWEGPI